MNDLLVGPKIGQAKLGPPVFPRGEGSAEAEAVSLALLSQDRECVGLGPDDALHALADAHGGEATTFQTVEGDAGRAVGAAVAQRIAAR